MSDERPTIAEVRALIASCPPSRLTALLRGLEADPRSGVIALVEAARGRQAAERKEKRRLSALTRMQRELHRSGLAVIAGLDEVGRGSLAGPLTTCAVILDVETVIEELDDSKKVPRERRPAVAARVRERAVAVSIAHASVEEIDSLGIAEATRSAWRRAVAGLGVEVDHVLVDGTDCRIGYPATAVVHGDALVAAIAAASCVAKVERDALMETLAERYPGYGFEQNRGYSTADHLEALARLGPCEIHRRSFAPCNGQSPLF